MVRTAHWSQPGSYRECVQAIFLFFNLKAVAVVHLSLLKNIKIIYIYIYKLHQMETKAILSYFLYIICLIFYTIGPTDLQLSPATQNVPGFSDIFSEVPKFHYHTKLCCKCRTRVYVFIKKTLIPGTISSTIKKNSVHPSRCRLAAGSNLGEHYQIL